MDAFMGFDYEQSEVYEGEGKKKKNTRQKEAQILLPSWMLGQSFGEQQKNMWTRNSQYHEIKAIKQ